MDPVRIKSEQHVLYGAGDYRGLSASLRPVARELVEVAGVRPGQRVLDVGTGDGNVACEALDRGATAVGCDLSLEQLRRARARDPRILLAAGDAERLPVAEGAYDAVLSCFAVILAPDPDLATAELFRAVAPGGVVALTAWADGGMMARLAAALRARAPDPESCPDQELGWGDAATATARLRRHASAVTVERRTLLIDPRVRGVAGEQDFSLRYAEHRGFADQLAAARAEAVAPFVTETGRVRADYLLAVARTG